MANYELIALNEGVPQLLAPTSSDIGLITNLSASGTISAAGQVTFTGGGALTGTWTDLGTVTTVDINGGTIDGTTQASGTINGPIAAGGTWTAAATWTLPALTLGGTVTSNGQSFSGTIADLGTVTTVDINGGTMDGTVIGGSTPAAGTFTTATTTNVDGILGANTPAAATVTTLTASGACTFNIGATFADFKINGSNFPGIRVTDTDLSGYVDQYVTAGSGYTIDVDPTNADGSTAFKVRTDGADRITVNSTGLGIGRAPNYKIDSYASGSGEAPIASANDTIVNLLTLNGTTSGEVGTITSHPLDLVAGNVARVRIGESGQGISLDGGSNYLSSPSTGNWEFDGAVTVTGVTAGAAATFECVANNTSRAAAFYHPTTGSARAITVWESDNGGANTIQARVNADGTFIVQPSGTEAVRLNGSGISLDGGSNYQIDGDGNFFHTVVAGITAGTTQTQAGATALTADENLVTTNGTNGDGVKLPPAVAGRRVTIINFTANTLRVWPDTGDDIDAGGINNADTVQIAAAGSKVYIAFDATNWRSRL